MPIIVSLPGELFHRKRRPENIGARQLRNAAIFRADVTQSVVSDGNSRPSLTRTFKNLGMITRERRKNAPGVDNNRSDSFLIIYDSS